MNVYVETNFILELVLLQEEHQACEILWRFAREGSIQLFIPAFCFAEPHEKLFRQHTSRKELQHKLKLEMDQLARTSTYAERIKHIGNLESILIQSNEEERQRFNRYREQLLSSANVIALTPPILKLAAHYEQMHDLTPQDAIVYASVINHLQQTTLPQSCFLSRNWKDFSNPDIKTELEHFNCKLIARFEDGVNYIRSQL